MNLNIYLIRKLYFKENADATHEFVEKTCGMKILTVEQVGDALMESFNYDKVFTYNNRESTLDTACSCPCASS